MAVGTELGLVVKAKVITYGICVANVGFPYRLLCVRNYLSFLLLCAM